jgi:hypothetical protein
MIPYALACLLSAAPADFKKVDETDGVLIESRPVEGSPIVELRLTTTTTKSVDSLCEAVFGDGKFDPEEPDLKSRKIISESADERVTYDQISPPLVANRDYAVKAKRTQLSDTQCSMAFSAANELAPPKPEVVVKFPSPYNAGKIVYNDKAHNCFVYNAEEVACPKDGHGVRPQPFGDQA